MSLARPRTLLTLPVALLCRRYQHGRCSTCRRSLVLSQGAPSSSSSSPSVEGAAPLLLQVSNNTTRFAAAAAAAAGATCRWTSGVRRARQCRARLYCCQAAGGLKVRDAAVQEDVLADAVVVPDGGFEDESAASPFAEATHRLRGLLTDADIWAEVKTWVVFSDLHLSRRTAGTCLQVLQTVHAEASARNAGIIFLGDFWHSRGALPVELLNLAISELQSWTCPTIFIPGNHDQVNMGGQVHALTVLEATNYFIKVISEPTQYLGALWLPFRRDHDVIRDAVTRHAGITAIFGHLDVIGAYMNEQRQASDGVDPSLFPPSLPVFTGHYHKPHVVDGSRVEYIGSPYQVSASESGQTKRFLLLNQQWHKLGEIPVDIGPRHYTVEEAVLDSQSIKRFRSGDRLRWLLPTETLTTDLKKIVAKLRQEGVHVELSFPSIAPKPRIEKAEDLDAFALFKIYARNVNMSEGATNAALDILHRLDLPSHVIHRREVHLKLEAVEMEGFGPFLEPFRYPLAQRGVRVVSGKNADSLGADSNGAGKTTLVMAPLWAITGSTDPRPDALKGLNAAHVVHYKSKRARVQVEGTVNRKSFMIERTAGRSASTKSTLRFVIDGKDETCQEIRLTQARIDESLNTALFERAVFHGQYGIGGLLEANDRTFKEELSRVLALDIWSQAGEQSKAELRDLGSKILQTEGALVELNKQNNQLADEVKSSLRELQTWESTKATKISTLEAELQAIKDSLSELLPDCTSRLDRVEGSIKEWRAFSGNLEQFLVASSGGSEVSETACKLENKEEHNGLLEKCAELRTQLKNANEFKLFRESLLNRFQKNVRHTAFCETCFQEIPTSHVNKHRAHLEEELKVAKNKETDVASAYKSSEEKLKASEEKLKLALLAIKEQEQRKERARIMRKEKASTISARVHKIWDAVASAQVAVTEAGSFFSQFKPAVRQEVADKTAPASDMSPGTQCNEDILLDPVVDLKVEHLKNLVSELLLKVTNGRKMVNNLQRVLQKVEAEKNETNPIAAKHKSLCDLESQTRNQLEQQSSSLEKVKQSAQWLKEVDAAFGHNGIQSYVLEGALAELQERTARFTQAFSGGSLGLLLNPTKLVRSKKTTVDSIEKIALVRTANGSVEHWTLQQLSGGERRRVALALELGYAELVAERGGLHCDLLVLDEVLQHLDAEGKARVLTVLRGLPHGTILLVSQAYSDVAEGFDLVDLVVKQDDAATVELAEDH